MNCVFLDSIHDLSAAIWNSIAGNDYPFTRHEFLAAMEDSGSANKKTGWQPQHLVVYDNQTAIAVMPLYVKYHSYGEYIFDWSWASAFERFGLPYYPKLLSAIPFTPATGPRLSIIDTYKNTEPLFELVAATLKNHATAINASSIHVLLPDINENKHWNDQGLSSRTTSQFHWYNDQYSNFDDFLQRFTSRKRKNLKKERQRIRDQKISLHQFSGNEITYEMWEAFYHFYQLTYAKRSGHGGYLRRDFFTMIAESMPEQILLVMAKYEDSYVAGALYFFDSETLYGRYWGCTQEFEMLHFEACYYQGIEFCIEKNLNKFDAGAQGEHKIQRGFVPTTIWSNHWIQDSRFANAIDEFIKEEEQHTHSYLENAKDYLPFKADKS